MRRKALKLTYLLLFVLLLCGCTSRSLGERAIVKMIYLDETNGKIEAGLVVFTCAPNSDTASVEGEAKIYVAGGRSIEEALYNAERQQNKKAFYAQNELLLFGPGAAKNVTRFLSHFASENAARPNLAAFLTPLSAAEFSECEDVINTVVREGERLIGPGQGEEDRTQSIFELDLSGENGMNGYLPVFTFSKEEKEFCGVREIVLIRDGKPDGVLRDAPMQLALLLAGKQRSLTANVEIEGEVFSFDTQQLNLTHTASSRSGAPCLSVRLTGKVDDITIDGIPVQKENENDAARRINEYLTLLVDGLEGRTFARGNDIFHNAWWLSQYDAAAVQSLQKTGLLYTVAQIHFESALNPV